ncbi:MAG TPA: hypothetical protein VF275_05460 [Gammaproteobacteria bacterium]
MTPIMQAVIEVEKEIRASGYNLSPEQCAAIIKRELEKAVPAKKVPGQTALRLYARTTSWNECRKAFLGGE